MAKLPPYKLQPVLEMRERKRDEALEYLKKKEDELQKQIEYKDQLKQELNQIIEEQKRAKKEKANPGSGKLTLQKLKQYDRYLERLRDDESDKIQEIREQDDAINKAKDDVAEAKGLLVEAVKAVKAIEMHREKWISKIKKEQAREEQKTLDEIGNVLYSFKEKDT